MPQAVAEYKELRRSPYAWISGRFIVPASRLDELCAELGQGTPFACSVIVNAPLDQRTWLSQAAALLKTVAHHRATSPALLIEAIEVPVPPLAAARDSFDASVGQCGMLVHNAGLRDLPVYVELTRSGDRFANALAAGMAALARTHLHAKVRCGGTTAQAFPSAGELAAFILAAHEHGVAWKATAGLHHPVRAARDAAGFPMHGFLNLTVAALLARQGHGQDALETVLEDADGAAFGHEYSHFTYRNARFGIQEIAAMRERAFHGYGSCSFAEPVDDLIALGLLARSEAAV